MAADEIHVGDVGTVFEFTVMDSTLVVDISTATIREVVFKKPDGATLTVAAVFSSTGSDGKIRYVTVAGDLNQAGQWSRQVRLVMPAGTWRSDVSVFTVYPNLA